MPQASHTAGHRRRKAIALLDSLRFLPFLCSINRASPRSNTTACASCEAQVWGGPTLGIAELMIEQAPGITRLLDRLERKKLVRRERLSDNRRQVLCFITKPGLDLLHELDTPVRNKVNQALHQLDESGVEELIRLLVLARGEQPSTTPAASSQ